MRPQMRSSVFAPESSEISNKEEKKKGTHIQQTVPALIVGEKKKVQIKMWEA